MINPIFKITKNEILSDNWYTLRKITYEYQKKDGNWETQYREAYDRGNGATILLYNKPNQTVILTRQLRIPTYLNGNQTGMMIEACAGLLDTENAEECIKRETEEERAREDEEDEEREDEEDEGREDEEDEERGNEEDEERGDEEDE